MKKAGAKANNQDANLKKLATKNSIDPNQVNPQNKEPEPNPTANNNIEESEDETQKLYKYYKFPDNSIYYGEIAWLSKEGKVLTDEAYQALLAASPAQAQQNNKAKPDDKEAEKAAKDKEFTKIRQGFGIMIVNFNETNGTFKSKYEGEFNKNKFKGKGKIIYEDGSMYEGEFNDNLYDGQGELIWTEGHIYKGMWKQGRMEGKGIFKHADGHELNGFFNNCYYLIEKTQSYLNPFLTKEEMETFNLKNMEYISKTNRNKFEKFSRENLIKVFNSFELFNAIEDSYKNNKVPLILTSKSKQATKQQIFDEFKDNYREIDLRYNYMKLHESPFGLNLSVFDEIKQIVIDAMTQGIFLILNFDDSKIEYEYTYDPDIREFYGTMMLSKFMWNPSLFFHEKCCNSHLGKRSNLKFDKNFKFICYSKFKVDEAVQEHDLINDLEKRFGKCFPLANMTIIIYSQKSL